MLFIYIFNRKRSLSETDDGKTLVSKDFMEFSNDNNDKRHNKRTSRRAFAVERVCQTKSELPKGPVS